MATNSSELDESLVVTTEIPFDDFAFELPGHYSFALYANNRFIGATTLSIGLPQEIYSAVPPTNN